MQMAHDSVLNVMYIACSSGPQSGVLAATVTSTVTVVSSSGMSESTTVIAVSSFVTGAPTLPTAVAVDPYRRLLFVGCDDGIVYMLINNIDNVAAVEVASRTQCRSPRALHADTVNNILYAVCLSQDENNWMGGFRYLDQRTQHG